MLNYLVRDMRREFVVVKKNAMILIEVLIVVCVLGILAAIVFPYLQNASEDAKIQALRADLQSIRSGMEIYKVQHAAGPCMGNADFVTCLTGKTDYNGNVWIDETTSGKAYGPYILKIPVNPFNNSAKVRTNESGVGGVGSEGWVYDKSAGRFYAYQRYRY